MVAVVFVVFGRPRGVSRFRDVLLALSILAGPGPFLHSSEDSILNKAAQMRQIYKTAQNK